MISVGVDLGSYSLKIAEVEATSKSYAIRRLHEIPFSLDLTKDKKIEAIDALRTLFAQYDPKQTQFIFAVPQKYVALRVLDFPFRERFKIQKAVAAQLEDDLPFSQEEAVFDTKVIRFKGRISEVLAMAVPKDRIKAVIDMAHDSSVEPTIVSTEGIALNNLLEKIWDNPPETDTTATEPMAPASSEVLIDIGHSTTELLVYREKRLVSIRNVDWGAKNIADAIGKKYGLNYVQAMRELQLKGFILLNKDQGSKDQQTFSLTIEKAIQEILPDIRLKLIEIQSDLNLQITSGSLIGGGSGLRNLGGFLTQGLEIPFNQFKLFDFHPAVTFEVTPQIESTMGTAIGLALEGLKRPRNPAINLLKDVFAKQSQMWAGIWQKWRHTAALVSTFFVLFVVYAMIRESLSLSLLDESDKVLKEKADKIAGLKGRKASHSQIQKFISNIEKEAKAKKLSEKVLRLNSALDILNLITGALPGRGNSSLEVKRLSIENESAEIHGFVATTKELEEIVKSLNKISANGRSERINTRLQAPSGKTAFAYRFAIKRFAGGPS